MSEDTIPERRVIAGPLANDAMTGMGATSMKYEAVALMPDVKVMKVGGQSVLDRGRAALFPILDELVPLKDKYQLLLCCGGGTRARHIYAVASELESEGLVVVESTRYLERRMVQPGRLAGPEASPAQRADLALGMAVIRALGAHDVGQACLVRQGTVLAVEALKIMETHKITSVIVSDETGSVAGVVHLHDLWRTQMV